MGLYLGDTIYNDSVVTEEHVRELIEANGKGVFFAEVGTTTYADTLAAYNDGKVVIAVKYDDVETDHATFYPLTTFDPDDEEGDEFTFSRDIGNTYEYYNLHVRGGWSNRIYNDIITVDAQLDSTSHNPVENMAIAAELTAINNKITGDLNDIFLVLASKGVTVPAGAGLDDVAGLIEDIQTGGGAFIPPDPNAYETYLYFEKPNDVSIRHNYHYSGLKISTDDIIEASIYIQNAIQESSLPGSADIGNGIFMQLFSSSQEPSGGSGRKIHFGYGPDRWTNTFEPTQYHLRCWATNWQNGSYYYGPCACVYIGDIAAGTMLNIKQTSEYLEVNGSRTNYSVGDFADFETDYYHAPDLYNTQFPDGARIYEINIKDKNGNPKYRFVPCKNKTLDVFGFWECMTGAFYNLSNNERPTPGPIMPIF